MTLKSIEKEISELHTVCCYEIIVDLITSETFGVICSYGLHVYEKSSKSSDITCKNISTNFALVRYIYEKLIDNNVLPIHVKDVVKDELHDLCEHGKNPIF